MFFFAFLVVFHLVEDFNGQQINEEVLKDKPKKNSIKKNVYIFNVFGKFSFKRFCLYQKRLEM